MCKAGQTKTGGGVLARMRHLQGQMGEGSPQNLGASGPKTEGEQGEGELRPPQLPPVLRLLSADVLTEACTLLDARSLAAAAAACQAFREVCQGPYPWRRLCEREWRGLLPEEEGGQEEEEEEEEAGRSGPAKSAAASAVWPRKRLVFRDAILDGDFRKLFPLIEQMPSGFDCALLRDHSDHGDGDGDGDNNNGDDGADDDDQAGEAADAAAAAGAEGAGHAYNPAAAAAAAAAVGTGGTAAAAAGPAEAAEVAEEAEEEAGDFVIKGVRRRRRRRQPTPKASPSGSTSGAAGVGSEGVASSTAPLAAVAAAVEGWPRRRSSSGDVALQVEFRGGLGVGNRCVRADLPLPSTILRERTGAAARSGLARHAETSPLALFRWLLAKMAATASGAGGNGGGGGGGSGAASDDTGGSGGGASLPPLTSSLFFGNQQQQNGGDDGQPQQHEDAAAAGDGQPQQPALFAHGGWVAAGAGAGAEEEERAERASSLPSGREGWAGGAGRQQEKRALPRAMCFPVALGGGEVDVTPRLVSYFEVTILTPRVDPPHAIPDCIAVGVSESGFPLKGKMPGWDACSYGYHSDDGGAFHDAGSMLFKCGPSFGPGDVVGCGLDYSRGGDRADIFFTLNGEALRSGNDGRGGRGSGGGFAAFRGVRGTFYPTVGVDSACPVRINLGGEPFRFDLASALRIGGQEAAARESVAQHAPRLSRPPSAGAASAAAAGGGSAAGAATPADGREAGMPDASSPPFAKRGAVSEPSSLLLPGRSRLRSLPAPEPPAFPAAATSANGGSDGGSCNDNPNVALSY